MKWESLLSKLQHFFYLSVYLAVSKLHIGKNADRLQRHVVVDVVFYTQIDLQ